MGHIIRRYSHEDDLKATEGKRDDEIVKLEAPATFAHVRKLGRLLWCRTLYGMAK